MRACMIRCVNVDEARFRALIPWGRQKLKNAICYDPYNSFLLVHVHTSGHTNKPIPSITHLIVLKNLTCKYTFYLHISQTIGQSMFRTR